MRGRISSRSWVVAGLMGAVAVVACDRVEVEDPLAVQAVAADLEGFWEGTGEITTADDFVGAGEGTAGFRFPVALQLRPDRGFVLWSANYPVAGGVASELRQCTGVYAVRNRAVTLLADQLCRALPLARYTVRRSGVGRIILEAPGTEPGAESASVRVRLILERVTEPPAVGWEDET